VRCRLAIALLAAVVALVLALAPAALAEGVQAQAGNSNTAHLRLTSDCSMHPDAWGEVSYNLSGSTLYVVMQGHELPTDGEYRLYYGSNQYVAARANDEGDLRIVAKVSGAGVASSARFKLRHIRQHAEGNSCAQGEQPDSASCVMLVSAAHSFVYTP
jgi:hypothetical protein